jgi:hypothetical protein
MSLKAFHIVFILASTLLTGGFGLWAWARVFGGEGSAIDVVYGISSIAALAALIWYGKYFLQKYKHLSYE